MRIVSAGCALPGGCVYKRLMASVRPSMPPILPKAVGDAAATPKGDYQVEKGDTLTKIATKMVVKSGGTATKANVAQALAALKAANPKLVTEAREGGKTIFTGEAVNLPKLDAQGGWSSPGRASPGAATPTVAGSTAAKGQMATMKLEKELTEAARTFSTKRPTAEEAKTLAALLEKVKTVAPKLLDTPAARVLSARLIPDATSPQPPNLPTDLPSKPQADTVELGPNRPGKPLE